MSSELDVVGHEAVRRALLAALARGALPPVLLLSGEAGIGKRHLARWLVAARWCTAGEDRPCGTCASCRKVLGGQHPDLHVVVRHPDKTQDPEELGSRQEITVDQIRRGLLPALALRAVEGGGRAAIIDDAESLNEGAQNALLKTLEEPPPNGLLLLVCSHEEALLDTVRSRCQSVRLAPLQPDEMARLFPGEDAALLKLAGGRPGRVATLAGLDVRALDDLLRGVLAGELRGSAFARAVLALIAARDEERAPAQAPERGARREAARGAEKEPRAERDTDADHRLVAELLLRCWREQLPAGGASQVDARLVEHALLELPADLARHIPPAVAWAAAGQALAQAYSIAHLGAGRQGAPHS